MVNYYRKNLVRNIHELKHKKKYLYQEIYHSNTRRFPEDYDWIYSMKKEYEQICSTLEVLENIQKEARKYEKAGKKV